MKKILFIIGSLRAKSFNRQVVHVAKEIIGNRAEVQELDYSNLPLLNQDIEQPESEVVARIRKAVAEASGISTSFARRPACRSGNKDGDRTGYRAH